jgi:hypothetical protein
MSTILRRIVTPASLACSASAVAMPTIPVVAAAVTGSTARFSYPASRSRDLARALLAVAYRGQSGNLGGVPAARRGHANDDTAARPRSPLGAQAEGIGTWTGQAELRATGAAFC